MDRSESLLRSLSAEYLHYYQQPLPSLARRRFLQPLLPLPLLLLLLLLLLLFPEKFSAGPAGQSWAFRYWPRPLQRREDSPSAQQLP